MKKIKREYKNLFFVVLPIIAFVITVDLLTKYFVNKYMTIGDEQVLITKLINLVNVHNDGAAWNIFSGNQIFLIIFTFVFLMGYGYLYYKEIQKGILFHISSAFLVAGCVGNLIDRIAFGYVRDMIQFDFWRSFPVFNVADSFVCIGIAILIVFYIIEIIKGAKKKEKNNG